jgi:hypothetical protein
VEADLSRDNSKDPSALVNTAPLLLLLMMDTPAKGSPVDWSTTLPFMSFFCANVNPEKISINNNNKYLDFMRLILVFGFMQRITFLPAISIQTVIQSMVILEKIDECP